MHKIVIPICFSLILTTTLAACSQATEISPQRLLSNEASFVDDVSTTMDRSNLETSSPKYHKEAQYNSAIYNSSIPKIVMLCLPKNSKEISLAALTQYEEITYYLLDLTVARDDRSFGTSFDRIIVTADSSNCKLLTPPEKSNLLITASLREFVSEPVANQLALDKWQRQQKALGGKTALQQEINLGTQPGPDAIELNPEDVWALDKLGIHIPEAALERLRTRESERQSNKSL